VKGENDMEFRELVKKRRAVREYEEIQVTIPLVKEIINESIQAPNARNAQPWAFIVITNKGLIKRLSDESKKNILHELEDNPQSTLMNYKAILEHPEFNVFYNAPCVVYIAGLKGIRTAAVDCALAASYFMLSAADRGLGTCWIDLGSVIRDPALKLEIGLSDDYMIVATLALGYPLKVPGTPPRDTPNILKIIE
jgi:nitroreductase